MFIGVEGEYIGGVDILRQKSEQLTLKPFLDRLESNLGYKYDSIAADTWYEGE